MAYPRRSPCPRVIRHKVAPIPIPRAGAQTLSLFYMSAPAVVQRKMPASGRGRNGRCQQARSEPQLPADAIKCRFTIQPAGELPNHHSAVL